jgi:hypothetical protein
LAAPVVRSEITLLLKTTAINYKSGARAERALTACCWIIIKSISESLALGEQKKAQH